MRGLRTQRCPLSRATELRIARARLAVIAEQLRAPSSPRLARAVALLEAAARRIDAEADRVTRALAPRPVRSSSSARRAVVSRAGSYVEYDDGRRVPRS